MTDIERLGAAVATVPDFPKKGIQFKDISPILLDPSLLSLAADLLADPLKNLGLTKLCGVESRGFILGPMVAERLGIGFVPIRKAGKLPRKTLSCSYELEYGSATIEVHEDDLDSNDMVVIHDDVLATGGTAKAAATLVQEAGAEVAAFSFIMQLDFLKGRERLGKKDSFYLLTY